MKENFNTIVGCLCTYCLALMACPVMAQTAQKDLTRADYNLWSNFEAGNLSDNSKWVSYSLRYENGKDTLFVKSTDGTALHSFEGGYNGNFLNNEKFVCLQRNEGMGIADLKTSRIHQLPGVVRYEISKSNFLLTEIQCDSLRKNLTVMNESGRIVFNADSITKWSYNSRADAIVYASRSAKRQRLQFLSLNGKLTPLLIRKSDDFYFSDFAWQNNGESVAFLQHRGEAVSLGLYRFAAKEYKVFRPENFPEFPSNRYIFPSSASPLVISPDGLRVFFGLTRKSVSETQSTVQVWNASDKQLYPAKIASDGYEGNDKTVCWCPLENRMSMLTNNILPNILPDNNHKKALLFNYNAYQPHQKMVGDTDFYLQDIEGGEKKFLLEKQSGDEYHAFFSPIGKYVTFFHDGNWWLYDIKASVYKNLTSSLPVKFVEEHYDWPGDIPAYGCPGWTLGDQALLVYDQYDVWKITPDGKAERLTNGRESGITFRIVPQNEEQKGDSFYSCRRSGCYDLSEGLFLKATNGKSNGFYQWDSKKGCRELVFVDSAVNQPKVGKGTNDFIYIEQNYNLPPRLMLKQGTASARVVFQSNPQHFLYKWGVPKIVEYQNSKGEPLKGILYYPAGYDASKSYPMIVRIYEKQTGGRYEYVNPTIHMQAGYNKTNLITQGYFVFEPDIAYEMGNPGLSAADCVVSAVKSVLGVPGVDGKRIGLMGHSFGGYETNFIITKTNIFAAAVAGAGISDLRTHFLTMNKNSSRPNNYHLESGQFRMVKTLFENQEAYTANSPVCFATEVKTPLLSWTGENDTQVSPNETMEFHLALRRLGKNNIMLIYEDEGHTLMQSEHQEDLTNRIEEWFGHYLKGEPVAAWMLPEKR